MPSKRQQAKDLIELAVDDRTPEKERLNSAMKAIAIIHKYDLLSSPIDALNEIDNETIRAATKIVEKITDPDLVSSLKKIGSHIGRRRRSR
jgi:hypothetical protein